MTADYLLLPNVSMKWKMLPRKCWEMLPRYFSISTRHSISVLPVGGAPHRVTAINNPVHVS